MIFQQVCEELKKSTGEELKQVLVFDHEAKEVDCVPAWRSLRGMMQMKFMNG